MIKQKLLTLFMALIATTALLASNTITYTARVKASGYSGSLLVGRTTFGPAITSHTFADGTGTIICGGEITMIGEKAFYNGSLKSVNIPNSVTTIGEDAFKYCNSLTSINVATGNTHYCSVDGVLFNYAKNTLIQCPIGNPRTEYAIPNSVTTIGKHAFKGCSGLTSVTIGNSVTTIGDYAFDGCSGLTSINVATGNTHYCSVDGVLFNYAKNTLIQCPIGNPRTEYAIPNSVTTIGEYAFGGCSGLTSITIPNSVTTIGNYAFCGCEGLTSINVATGNTHYCSVDGVLFNCAKNTLIQYPIGNPRTEYTIPNSVTTIGSYAFEDCYSLTSVTIPNSVTTIGDYAFCGCEGLTGTLIIPNSVTTIGNNAFSYCSGLKSITIGNSVTTIGNKAFKFCEDLTSVTIPNSVTTIGEDAFRYCSGLKTITCCATNPPTCGIACFDQVNKTIPVYVPVRSVDAYKQANEWKDFTNILNNSPEYNVITYTAKEKLIGYNNSLDIGKTTFGSAITSHTFANGKGTITCNGAIVMIGDYAFDNCSSLTSVTIPNSVTAIGDDAFAFCDELTSVTISNSVTTIGNYAFYYCEDLTSITIPNSVTTIGDYAFCGCSGLMSITCYATIPPTCGSDCFFRVNESIPVYVPALSADAYKQAETWKDFTNILNNSPEYNVITYTAKEKLIGNNNSLDIGKTTFGSAITSHTFANGTGTITCNGAISMIGEDAFAWCSGLTSVTIPNSVTTIGDEAFKFCDELTSVTISNSVTTIGNYAFHYCSGLTSVTIPNSVTTIGDYAFCGCEGLTGTLIIPNSVTTIGERAFCGCEGLTGTLIIPNSVKGIREWAFASCKGLTSVTIPNSITRINAYTFLDCRSLTSVTIPNSVKTIGEYAFGFCSGLTSVTIGNAVTKIEKYAFDDCSQLTSVTCYAITPPSCVNGCFFNGTDDPTSASLYVPTGHVWAYKQAEEWKKFTNILPIGAEEVPATEPIITPDDHSVTITWPQTDNADTYTLEIRKNGELFCTITFNNQGVMIDITFAAPARNGVRTSSAAEMTSNGYKFTINGLEPGTEYTYAVIAKDASAQPLQTYSGSFETTMPTGLENLTIDKKVGNKFIYGNHLYILGDGNLYTATGARVK